MIVFASTSLVKNMNSVAFYTAIGACCLLSVIITPCSSSTVSTNDTSNGSFSVYLETCCNRRNFGLNIIKHKDDATISIIMCPSILPVNCPKLNYSSCLELSFLYPNSVSGYYNVTLYNGSIIEVYCDMKGDHCDGEGGWTRIAYINTTLPDPTCPEGLTLSQWYAVGHQICIKGNEFELGCSSVYYSSNGYQYSQVCGQARGYTDHAHAFHYNNFYNLALNSAYVDGVSITRGDPRQHIWTYAAGDLWDSIEYDCPCNEGSSAFVPHFVKNDYYCEIIKSMFSDPLWDGIDCEEFENGCCQQPQMPWFLKQLNEYTDDDIEVRLCSDDHTYVPIDILEIYLK